MPTCPGLLHEICDDFSRLMDDLEEEEQALITKRRKQKLSQPKRHAQFGRDTPAQTAQDAKAPQRAAHSAQLDDVTEQLQHCQQDLQLLKSQNCALRQQLDTAARGASASTSIRRHAALQPPACAAWQLHAAPHCTCSSLGRHAACHTRGCNHQHRMHRVQHHVQQRWERLVAHAAARQPLWRQHFRLSFGRLGPHMGLANSGSRDNSNSGGSGDGGGGSGRSLGSVGTGRQCGTSSSSGPSATAVVTKLMSDKHRWGGHTKDLPCSSNALACACGARARTMVATVPPCVPLFPSQGCKTHNEDALPLRNSPAFMPLCTRTHACTCAPLHPPMQAPRTSR